MIDKLRVAISCIKAQPAKILSGGRMYMAAAGNALLTFETFLARKYKKSRETA
jgi:hypothetical protein